MIVLRWIVHCVTRFFAVFEVTILKTVQRVIKPKYAVVGDCVKCGRCCKEILFSPPAFIRSRPAILKLFLFYHAIVHNFVVVGQDGPDLVFSCGHLRSDNRCGIHKWRPFICRNFPVIPWFEPPKILPYCSYQVAAEPVTKMQQRQSLRILNSQVSVHHPSPDLGPQHLVDTFRTR
jgi:hypothetical protein